MQNSRHPDTNLIHHGRTLATKARIVNPPVYRASTILFPTCEAMDEAEAHWHETPYYGRHGHEPTFAFEQALAECEEGYRAIVTCSGAAALVVAIGAFVGSGDHVLIVDSAYIALRKYADAVLSRFGVSVTYYPATADIDGYIQDNTKVIYAETPGSLTFEMQDIPAIVRAAKPRNIRVIVDNTWATPLHFKPLRHGADVVIHAATKYIGGHSDLMMGVIVTNRDAFMPVKKSAYFHGQHAAPDSVYLAHRGLRTLAVRLRQHEQNALSLARWLEKQPQIARVLCPMLEGDPGHALWHRDFTGGCGLFAIVLSPHYTRPDAYRFVNALGLFGIGFSWGGFESLALPVNLKPIRSATVWQEGEVIRLHAGLEQAEDLRLDIAHALAVMEKNR